MARPDLHPSHGPMSPYSSVSCIPPAAENMPPQYASSANPPPPTTMTKPLYDQHPTPSDGQSYSTYPECYGFSNPGPHDAAAAGGGGGRPGWGPSAICQTQGGYPDGCDYGLGGVELAFPPSPSGITRGGEGNGLQQQVPWDSGAQLEAYPSLIGSGMAMANRVFPYAPVEDSMSGCYESLSWPPPLVGQISPSPSQSSYQVSSPASGSGPQFSRHNSCSSLPASRFRPVPDQAVSQGEGQLSPGGTVANGETCTVTDVFSSVDQTTRFPWGNTQNRVMMSTTATDCNAGTVSPAMTPSPKDSTAGAPYQPVSKNARGASDHRPSKSSTAVKNAPRATGQTAQQKKPQPPEPQSQTRPAPARARNREAANKCRAKTKLAASELESTERAMSSEHRELSVTARGLRDEVLMLKNELLAHGNCDDNLIQQYLTNQARMVGGGGGGAMHSRHQQHQ